MNNTQMSPRDALYNRAIAAYEAHEQEQEIKKENRAKENWEKEVYDLRTGLACLDLTEGFEIVEFQPSAGTPTPMAVCGDLRFIHVEPPQGFYDPHLQLVVKCTRCGQDFPLNDRIDYQQSLISFGRLLSSLEHGTIVAQHTDCGDEGDDDHQAATMPVSTDRPRQCKCNSMEAALLDFIRDFISYHTAEIEIS